MILHFVLYSFNLSISVSFHPWFWDLMWGFFLPVLFYCVPKTWCHDRSSNLEMILSLLRELGYVTTTAKLRTDQFGIPQRRSRIYFFGIRDAVMNSEEQRTKILERLDALQQDLVLTPESCFTKKCKGQRLCLFVYLFEKASFAQPVRAREPLQPVS